ncbi:hypothetical protein [Treponema maltophilum]|uniref:hypothetical protein n=1 Tax=Treponema maltophilum TaxID=51160 RepID=UPI003D8D8CD2
MTKEFTGGLNASWRLGSDLKDDPNNVKAGARFDINPYLLWTINKTHMLSLGVRLTIACRSGCDKTLNQLKIYSTLIV